MNLDNTINLNIDGSITTNELIYSFENSTHRKILHKLIKHLIPGIQLKLFIENDLMIEELQDHVKNTIAPYKYPRSILFKKSLPKTKTGKIQRFLLRENSN